MPSWSWSWSWSHHSRSHYSHNIRSSRRSQNGNCTSPSRFRLTRTLGDKGISEKYYEGGVKREGGNSHVLSMPPLPLDELELAIELHPPLPLPFLPFPPLPPRQFTPPFLLEPSLDSEDEEEDEDDDSSPLVLEDELEEDVDSEFSLPFALLSEETQLLPLFDPEPEPESVFQLFVFMLLKADPEFMLLPLTVELEDQVSDAEFEFSFSE